MLFDVRQVPVADVGSLSRKNMREVLIRLGEPPPPCPPRARPPRPAVPARTAHGTLPRGRR